ncbi:trypco2 family protein [Streptomyces sp. NPDC001034]|uniref:trypco2 family protein n=1 Tax=Streptomyces sp. NPDC001034 TaxID=3154375 RepID=UPI003317F946
MIELAEMISELGQELNDALTRGPSGVVRFELGPVEVEADVVVSRKGGANGKVRFWVVEAGAEGRLESSRTHRVRLTLHPKLVAPDGTHVKVLVSGEEEEGER